MAVEVKHGGKGWSVRDLERALEGQLARDYLKPAMRRHGVLVVSHHGARAWRDPDNRRSMDFAAVGARLERVSSSLESNRYGPIEVRFFGIGASQRPIGRRRR